MGHAEEINERVATEDQDVTPCKFSEVHFDVLQIPGARPRRPYAHLEKALRYSNSATTA